MANIRLWYVLTLQFFAWSLYELWTDGYGVSYRVGEHLNKDLAGNYDSIRLCVPIDQILEKTKLKERFEMPENGTVDITEFTAHCAWALGEFVNISMGPQGSYLYNNHFCFKGEESKLNLLYWFSSFGYKIFIYTGNLHTPFKYFVYDQKQEAVKPIEFKTFRARLNYLGYPFTNCTHGNLTKSICLNNCLKELDRKALYLYNHEEGGFLNLTNVDRNLTDEISCNDYCKQDNCVTEQVLSVNLAASLPDRHPEGNLTFDDKYFNIIVDRTIPNFYFWLNFIGLLTLLTNLSFSKEFSDLADLVSRRVIARFPTQNKLTNFLQNFRPKLRFLVLVISCIAFKEFVELMLKDHHKNWEDPIKTQIAKFDFNTEPFSVVVCIPVQYLLERPSLNATYELDPKRDEQILSNYTFGEILNLTNDGLDWALKGLFIRIGSIQKEFAWETSNQTLFRKCRLPVKRQAVMIFSRCFRRQVNIHEPCYQRLLSASTLEIDLKHYVYLKEIYSIYLLEANVTFTSEAHLHTNRYKVNKKITKLIANCDNSPFDMDTCRSLRFLGERKTISTNSIIDLDEIIKWNQTTEFGVKLNDLAGLKLNNSVDQDIVNECKRNITQKCSNKVFVESYRTLHFDPEIIRINIYYELIVEEELIPSCWKLTLNIVNLSGIIFGMTVANLIPMLFAPIKLAFRIQATYFKHAALLVCTVGLVVHSCVIFNDIISSELIPGSFFEKKATIDFPDVVFCFHMANEGDPNHKLTGNYLNRLNDELKFESIFDRLSYLVNGSFTDLSNITLDAPYDPEAKFRFSVFHYHKMKCFEIGSFLSYEKNELFFDPDPYFLKVFFRKEFLRSEMDVYYLCKKRTTKYFNEIFKLRLVPLSAEGHNSFKVKLELSITEKSDKFKYFKNPLLLFFDSTNYSDLNDYIRMMRNAFLRRFNYSSNLIPLVRRDFVQEIENDLFDQYYLQVQKIKDEFNQVDNDFEHELYNNRISFQFADQSEPTFAFTMTFSVERTVITNEESHALLIQNLVNLLSLWLNLNVLDIPLHKFFSLFPSLQRILIALRDRLKRIIKNSQKSHSRKVRSSEN